MRLIDADALLERIRNGSNDADWYYEDLVEKAPTIDPVRHGRLKSEGWDEAWCEWGECSVCGKSNMMGSKYCNDCGAKLDEKGAVTDGEDKG